MLKLCGIEGNENNKLIGVNGVNHKSKENAETGIQRWGPQATIYTQLFGHVIMEAMDDTRISSNLHLLSLLQ